jgi:hypothetical protein
MAHPVHDIEVPDDISAFVPSVIEIEGGDGATCGQLANTLH